MKSPFTHVLRKTPLLFCLVFLQCLFSYGQSESHDFITYDTTIRVYPVTGDAWTWSDWIVRISRPANMFTANHPDTASRPVILTMPGQGEQNTYDTTKLGLYGPHYWLKNGWDGGVTLANGKHYPILITVACATSSFPTALNMAALLKYLRDHYHIKGNSVHVAGLSQGAFTLTSTICFEYTANAETGMKLINSIVALQGFSTDQNNFYEAYNRRLTAYKIWAKKYGGHYFGLEGTSDPRNVAAGEKAMNDTLPGSAYFAYENLGSGSHCCWNSMYDPSVTNWQSFSPYGTYVATGTDTNSRGNYLKGWNIFQWMLRQGDTAMVNPSTPPPATSYKETHDFITYDTTIHIQPTSNIYYWTNWNVRISRPANMFTANHADTASRPVLLTMPGYGEQNSTDTANLTKYGPHSWLKNGWDGSVVLANGKHYPILITVACTSNSFPDGENTAALIKFLTDHYHIKKNAVHLAGLGQGAVSMTAVISFERPANDETGMKQVTSLVALQGFSTEEAGDANSWNRRLTAYKIWAKKYGGRYFGIEGASDINRNVSAGSKAMNDTLPGSAYFAYHNVSGGGFCCWDTMYNPAVNNWQSFSPYGTYITTGTDTNSRGTYVKGSSVFQWMLRQGDTAMVNPVPDTTGGATASKLVVKKVIVDEYKTWYLTSDSLLYAYNNGSDYPVQYPLGSRKAISGAGGANFFRVIDDQGYIWTSRNLSTTTDRIDTDSAGNAFNNNIFVDAYASTSVSIRSDNTVWYWGKDSYNMFYTGGMLGSSGTGTLMKPMQLSPSGMQFKKVLLGGNRIVGLTTAGDVYEWTPGGGRTPTLKTTPRAAVDIFVSHLNVAGCIIPDAGSTNGMGYPYVWGTATSMYGGGSANTQPTSLKTLWGITVPIKEIAVSWNTIHYIDSLGRLFGCGFNSMGEVGNGHSFVNQYNYPGFPGYGWTFTDYENPSGIPVQIGTGVTWKHLYSNNWFAFYKYAQDVNDSIYSWGRNKSLVLGNGFKNNDDANSYDAMDVLTPTMVHPLIARYQTYDFTAPVLNAGSDQTISTTSTTLSATGHAAVLKHAGTLVNGVDSVGYHWVSFQWTQVAGAACTLSTPTAQTTAVTGLTNGVYKFRVLATDNNTGTIVDTVQVTVSTGAKRTSTTLNGSSVELEGLSAGKVQLYPSVVHGSQPVNLVVDVESVGTTHIRIFDVNGKLLQTIVTSKNSRQFSRTLDVSRLSAGTYMVQVVIGGRPQFTTRFIKS